MTNALAAGVERTVARCVLGPQLASMTTKTDLLGNLRLEWRRVGRTPSAREATRRLEERHPHLRLEAQDDLVDVVALLESRSGRNVLERAEIVRALLVEASDPDVHRALLQTLLPGVVSTCRQLRFGDGIIDDPSDTLSMAVSLLSELLVDWAGQSRQYAAPDLLSALRGRLRRWLLKEKEALKNVSHFDHVDRASEESSSLLTRLESLRGGQHARLVRLTYARVFEGRSFRELAADDHSAPVSLQSELQHFAVRFLL
ncbi:MAG TPA: hypothetical protein VGZ68_01950 [Acidimicrobiales bacterium]|jgi:hypothetical protein|nr:hypothetical protein [Acidimicrobiales bacterium]